MFFFVEQIVDLGSAFYGISDLGRHRTHPPPIHTPHTHQHTHACTHTHTHSTAAPQNTHRTHAHAPYTPQHSHPPPPHDLATPESHWARFAPNFDPIWPMSASRTPHSAYLSSIRAPAQLKAHAWLRFLPSQFLGRQNPYFVAVFFVPFFWGRQKLASVHTGGC